MPSLSTIFNICLFHHFAFLNEAKEVWFDSADTLIQFDNFVENKFHYLAVPNKIGTIKVPKLSDCALQCLTTSTCLSLNIASASDEKGIFWCELLSADMFNVSHSFGEKASSHHLSRWVSKQIFFKLIIFSSFNDFFWACPWPRNYATAKICRKKKPVISILLNCKKKVSTNLQMLVSRMPNSKDEKLSCVESFLYLKS